MPQDQTFARDLGYLAKFFDSLRRHADTLAPDAGDRLRTLIGEEEIRWEEIKALVAGGSPGGNSSVNPTTASEPAGNPEPEATYLPNPLTVGSLIGS